MCNLFNSALFINVFTLRHPLSPLTVSFLVLCLPLLLHLPVLPYFAPSCCYEITQLYRSLRLSPLLTSFYLYITTSLLYSVSYLPFFALKLATSLCCSVIASSLNSVRHNSFLRSLIISLLHSVTHQLIFPFLSLLPSIPLFKSVSMSLKIGNKLQFMQVGIQRGSATRHNSKASAVDDFSVVKRGNLLRC